LTVELEDGSVVPAGMALMNKDVLRIALVEGDGEGAYPVGFYTDDFGRFIDDDNDYFQSLVLGNGGEFPDGMEDSVRRAIVFWTDSDVEFVSIDDDPDINVFAFETDGNLPVISLGRASFPDNNSDNDRYASYGGDVAYVGINVGLIGLPGYSDVVLNGGSFNDAIEDFLKHEFGHNFGVIHPRDAGEDLRANMDAGKEANKDIQSVCTGVDIDDLQAYFINATMSVDSSAPNEVRRMSEYDSRAIDYLKTGVPPNAVKP